MSSALASTFTARIAVMAFRASGGLQGLCVAIAAGGAAVVDSAAPFIGNAGVRTGVGGKPVIRCMTARTVQAKHACVENWVTVAACTVGR